MQFNSYQPWPVYQPYAQQQGIAGVRFVSGIEEARSVGIPYGGRALFMDANEDVFYIKETDWAGASTIETYKFEKVEPPKPDYVSRTEFEELKRAYESAVQQGGLRSVPNAGTAGPQRQPDVAAAGPYQVNQPAAGQGAGPAPHPGAWDYSGGVGRDCGAGI